MGPMPRNIVTSIGGAWPRAYTQRKKLTPLETPMKTMAAHCVGEKLGQAEKKPPLAASAARKATAISMAK